MANFGQTLCFLVGFVLCVTVNGQFSPCENQPNDTIIQFGCFAYKECQAFQVVDVPCAEGEVFERASLKCKPNATANTACGMPMDCGIDKSGFFADVQYGCETFYRCYQGTPYVNSRQYCGLTSYFSQKNSFCGQKYQVEPPCGTYVAPKPKP